MQNTTPQSIQPKLKNKKSVTNTLFRGFFFLALGVALLFVIGTIVVIAGSYTAHWNSRVVETVSTIVPFPVTSVNGHWKSYQLFLDTVSALEYSYSTPEGLSASGLTSKPTHREIEAIVLDRIMKDEMVRQFAAKRGIVVTQTVLDAEMQKLIEQSGNEQEVRDRIKTLYGWGLDTFAERVVQPYLVRQRLQDSIGLDSNINSDAEKRAQAALARVKSGKEDFQTIAREVNEDSTKSVDGDFGVFARGERDQAIEEVVFSLSVGQTSDIVRTTDGFHIFKLIEKIKADEEKGLPEKVHVAHIFIAAKPLDQWLFEQSKSQKASIFLSGFSWDKQNARVVDKKTSGSSQTESK